MSNIMFFCTTPILVRQLAFPKDASFCLDNQPWIGGTTIKTASQAKGLNKTAGMAIIATTGSISVWDRTLRSSSSSTPGMVNL